MHDKAPVSGMMSFHLSRGRLMELENQNLDQDWENAQLHLPRRGQCLVDQPGLKLSKEPAG
jgi:hypothetical protein